MNSRPCNIAIVGIGGRFPGAEDPRALWRNLVASKSAIVRVPEQRWPKEILRKHFDGSVEIGQWGGLIDDADCFDASFFGISRREAAAMDPQQRMALELAWSAIEDAGYSARDLAGSRTAVFMGVCHSDYLEIHEQQAAIVDSYYSTGVAYSIISNRISHYFDFKGQSVTNDTACASSLISIQQAVEALQRDECSLALAGGVNLCWSANHFVAFTRNGMLSREGVCKTFDAQADGYVRGEGGAILVLKRLEQAERDGDHIYSVIKGIASNHGGRTSSLTAMNPQAQAELIEQVVLDSGIPPETISYIETHGIGTPLGDPIEVHGLQLAFRRLAEKTESAASDWAECGLGSIKPNIGHLEAAAGVTSVIKVLGSMQQKLLPATLNFSELNALITLDGTRFYIVDSSRAWNPSIRGEGIPRRAGVSSFGFGGVNAHLVLEEYQEMPDLDDPDDAGQPVPIVLSAKSEAGLVEQAKQLRDFLVERGCLRTELIRIAYTLQVGREPMRYRLGLLARDCAGLIEDLAAFLSGQKTGSWRYGSAGQVVDAIVEPTCDSDKGDQPDFGHMLESWVNGASVPWSKIHAKSRPRRISLPTYPFERRRYWLESVSPNTASENSSKLPAAKYAGEGAGSPLERSLRNLESPDEMFVAGQTQEPSVAGAAEEDKRRGSESFEEPTGDGWVFEAIQTSLRGLIFELLGSAGKSIDIDDEIGALGLDSIALKELTNQLNRLYQLRLVPTMFFEYRTLREISEYLLVEHHDAIVGKHRLVSPDIQASAKPTVQASSGPKPETTSHGGNNAVGNGAHRSGMRQDANHDHIAIVGLSFCVPGATYQEMLWENLTLGRDCISSVPPDRWDWRTVYGDPLTEPNRTNIKWGGFIDSVEQFDPSFFGISPREAVQMDPRQRLVMTHAWRALEDAGYAPMGLGGSNTGIFVGMQASDYLSLGLPAEVPVEGYSAIGRTPSFGPNRVSYFLDLHGPSEPIETACSSSLVAVHRAVRAIHNGDCEMALAGGVNTVVTSWEHISFSKAGMLSEDGRCKTFSKDANGYVRSEGVGILLLKRLAAAERDGDHIYGLVRGSAENHGGRANSLTAPNPKAQAELIKAAHRAARVDPRTVTYIEAHGTGTPLGDPIEINGLKSAFAELYAEHDASSADQGSCGLGSVKTNIGHLELAAGIAGVIKVLLQFKHQTLVKSLHCEEVNPYINLQGSPFYLVRETQPWKALHDSEGRAIPRRAGVSSFGFGGVNSHVILEEYLGSQEVAAPRQEPAPERPALIVLSAKKEERLREQASLLLEHLSTHNYANADLIDIAYTLQVGRDAMDHRLALTASTIAMLQEKLADYLAGKTEIAECYRGEARKSKETLLAFTSDDDIDGVLSRWIERGKYAKLLGLWTKGFAVSWTKLYCQNAAYAETNPKRISLPTYPFAKEKYWLGSRSREIVDGATSDGKDAARSIASSQPAGNFAALDVELHRESESRRIVLRPLKATTFSSIEITPTQPARTEEADGVGTARSRDVVLDDNLRSSHKQRESFVSLGELEHDLRSGLAETLYMDRDEVELDTTFVELGLDSIIGVEWVRSINNRYGLAVNATKLYDYPTIRTLAEWLHGEISEASAPATIARQAEQNGNRKSVRLRVLDDELDPTLLKNDQGRIGAAEKSVNGANVQSGGRRQFTAFDELEVPQGIKSAKVLETELRSSLAKALYVERDDIELDRPFVELGLDSIIGIEWVRDINSQYGLALSATKLYDCSTIRSLAGWLQEDLIASRPRTAQPQSHAEGTLAGIADTEEGGGHAVDGRIFARRQMEQHERTVTPPSAMESERSIGDGKPARRLTSHTAPVPMKRSYRADAIAIIGMSGKYPGANELSSYWDNLAAGRNSIEELPVSRWPVKDYFDPRPGAAGKVYCKWLGRVEDVDCFDPLFFNISPAEAEIMDPQHRLFLEEGYKAFQDAGYDARQLSNRKCGVYLGMMGSEYLTLLQHAGQGLGDTTGNSAAIAAARIAYYLNLKGPAIPIDTACSSSLVAAHLACQALRANEIEMALVGGVTLYLTPESYIGMCSAGMLSPEGQCKTFDNGANGFVPADGVGVLVLKRLTDAEADGDGIYGVIVGSGINQDGKTNGITAPSSSSQMELVRDIYERYDIHPESISYVEMHGTGTKLGDPIELQALSAVFRESTGKKNYCAIGSVKSNIGHTSAAAGVAGVHKVLLALQRRELVPTLNFKVPNEHFDFSQGPFFVNTERRTWTVEPGHPRRAAVSSFGFSGTNAHMVIEEYEAPQKPEVRQASPVQPSLIVLSAKNEERLREQASQLLAHLSAHSYTNADLMDIAYTLQVGRDAMDHRLALTAGTVGQLKEKLTDYLAGKPQITECYRGEVRKSKEALSAFTFDDDIDEAVNRWIERGKYAKLLELWTKGFAVSWAKLYRQNAAYAETNPRRISLPTYPFARERYWMIPAQTRERSFRAHIEQDESRLGDIMDALIADKLTVGDATKRAGQLLSS